MLARIRIPMFSVVALCSLAAAAKADCRYHSNNPSGWDRSTCEQARRNYINAGRRLGGGGSPGPCVCSGGAAAGAVAGAGIQGALLNGAGVLGNAAGAALFNSIFRPRKPAPQPPPPNEDWQRQARQAELERQERERAAQEERRRRFDADKDDLLGEMKGASSDSGELQFKDIGQESEAKPQTAKKQRLWTVIGSREQGYGRVGYRRMEEPGPGSQPVDGAGGKSSLPFKEVSGAEEQPVPEAGQTQSSPKSLKSGPDQEADLGGEQADNQPDNTPFFGKGGPVHPELGEDVGQTSWFSRAFSRIWPGDSSKQERAAARPKVDAAARKVDKKWPQPSTRGRTPSNPKAPKPRYIGLAQDVVGEVQAVSPTPGAPPRKVRHGSPLFLNDTVTTRPGGRVTIKLVDDTVFTIGPNNKMVLDEFVYEPDPGANQYIKGFLRLVTGRVSKSDRPRVYNDRGGTRGIER